MVVDNSGMIENEGIGMLQVFFNTPNFAILNSSNNAEKSVTLLIETRVLV